MLYLDPFKHLLALIGFIILILGVALRLYKNGHNELFIGIGATMCVIALIIQIINDKN